MAIAIGVYACGCATDGTHCAVHARWSCHYGPDDRGGECPPCRRLRWLSVNPDRCAMPSRTFRPSRETRALDNEGPG